MKEVIKNYVNNLTIDNVKDFLIKSNYNIKEEEINIIYRYIKEYCDDILNGKEEIFNKLKQEVCEDTYNEIMRLCDKYKKYI